MSVSVGYQRSYSVCLHIKKKSNRAKTNNLAVATKAAPSSTLQPNPPRASTLQNVDLVDDEKQSQGHDDGEKDENADQKLVVVCKVKLEAVRVTDAQKNRSITTDGQGGGVTRIVSTYREC